MGRTGQVTTDPKVLADLPIGSVVVPMWTGSPAENGLNACAKFAPNAAGAEPGRTRDGIWLRAIDDRRHPSNKVGVHPLGPRPGTGGHAVKIVYDPRDIYR